MTATYKESATCALQGLLWVADMIKQALAPALGGSSLPPTLYADDLENLGKGSWLAFQHLLVANDRSALAACACSHWERKAGLSSCQHGLALPGPPALGMQHAALVA